MSIANSIREQFFFKFKSISNSLSEYHFRDGLGLSHLDLASDFVDPVKIVNLLTRISWMNVIHNNEFPFLDYKSLIKRHAVFVATGEVTLNRKLYSLESPKWPAVVKCSLLAARTRSFTLVIDLILGSDTEASVSLKKNIATIDRDTMKRSPLPDWWLEMYKADYTAEPLKRFDTLEPPSVMSCRGAEVSPFTRIITRSDTDVNNHAGTTIYAGYCVDALEHHLNRTTKSCRTNKPLLLKHLEFIHKGESKLGDVLTVNHWDDNRKPGTVFFNVLKGDRSVYQAMMTFHEDISTTSRL